MKANTRKGVLNDVVPKREPAWFRVVVICGIIISALMILGFVADAIYNYYRYGSRPF